MTETPATWAGGAGTVVMILKFAFIGLLVLCAAWDLYKLKIPNVFTVALALLFVIAAGVSGGSVGWLGHIVAGGAVFAFGALLFRFGYVGGGDVKLSAVMALWMGTGLIAPFLLLTAAFGLLAALVLRVVAPVVFAVAARLLPASFPAVPRVLQPGAGIPYGVPLAAAGILLVPRMPGSLWGF
jgi:prepilin peptidase CpaA